MNQYLINTETAMRGLIEVFNREENRFDDLTRAQQHMANQAETLFDLGKQHGFSAELWIELDGFETAAQKFGKDAAESLRSIALCK